ncbi:hypothetical protein Dsin_006830 [Dipteronia sinensis]|uniref:Uncharacterized protein n=1 Tax=Dipteronia sinensis TaxID=43782 RepID=A0AAE0B015_9ROSI|nr:hypothetical protein Dsin_006830 [Dipteronia sinensis]
MEEPQHHPSLIPLRRRNSISTSVPLPSKLTLPPKPLHTTSLPNASTSPSSFEFISFKSSLTNNYTSLKDILPFSSKGGAAAVNSPTPRPAVNYSYEISIRNHLVKQAAWAYLQPMSASPGSSGHHYFRRIWMRFTSAQNSISSCLRYINSRIISGLSRAIDRIRRAIFVHVS